MELKDIYGNLIWSGDAESIYDAVTKSKMAGKSLYQVDLSRASLSGADLSEANLSGADLSGANLSRASLSGADLSGADLSRAYLSGADLSGADLSGADLSRANLSRASLSGADLSGAKGFSKYISTPLYILLDQPGKIRAAKLVTNTLTGPYNPGIYYILNTEVSADANLNENKHCGSGINVATLDWCIREWQPGYKILLIEFEAKDIACIPIGSDGKFRLHRGLVVGEKCLKELGLET